jgi:hypothetical protein
MLDRAKSEEGIDSFPSHGLDLTLADDQADLEEGPSYSESCNSRSLSVSSSGSDDQASSAALNIYSLDIAVSHLADDAPDTLFTVSSADAVSGTPPALPLPFTTTEHMVPYCPVPKEVAQARLTVQLDMREGMTISEGFMLQRVISTDSQAFAPPSAGARITVKEAALLPAPGTCHPVPYGPSAYR